MPVLKHRIYREIQVYDISIRNTCDIIGLKTTMLSDSIFYHLSHKKIFIEASLVQEPSCLR